MLYEDIKHTTYPHLDCNILPNSVPLTTTKYRSGQRSKQGEVICKGSQHVDRIPCGAQTYYLWIMSPARFQ